MAISSSSWVWGQNDGSCPPLHFSLPPHVHLTVPLLPKLKPGSDLHSLLWQHTVNPMMLCFYFVQHVLGIPVICASIQKDSGSYSAKHCRKSMSPGYKCPSLSCGEKASLKGTHGTKPFWPKVLWKVLAHHETTGKTIGQRGITPGILSTWAICLSSVP